MKSYKNKIEHFVNFLEPGEGKAAGLYNLFNITLQDKFRKYLSENIELEVVGELSSKEQEVLENIKIEIELLKKKFPGVKPERLEFDLARIFYSNFSKLGFGRFHVNEVGMWRWISMQYFNEEVFWRWGKADFDKRDIKKAAKATFDHCVGKRSRDIFPRRYFILGQRLFDKNNKFALIDKLAEKSRESRAGGFGNLISNLIETKLISPNDYVSKVISKIMFTENEIGDDKEVKNAFIRYNAYKKRLLSNASENVFKNEICFV